MNDTECMIVQQNTQSVNKSFIHEILCTVSQLKMNDTVCGTVQHNKHSVGQSDIDKIPHPVSHLRMNDTECESVNKSVRYRWNTLRSLSTGNEWYWVLYRSTIQPVSGSVRYRWKTVHSRSIRNEWNCCCGIFQQNKQSVYHSAFGEIPYTVSQLRMNDT